jgi:hypothetical protein
MILKVWDNGGKTYDRYTIRIRNDYHGMSANPFDPQGFCQYCGSYPDIKEGKNLGKLVYNCGKGNFMNLPADVRKAITERT